METKTKPARYQSTQQVRSALVLSPNACTPVAFSWLASGRLNWKRRRVDPKFRVRINVKSSQTNNASVETPILINMNSILLHLCLGETGFSVGISMEGLGATHAKYVFWYRRTKRRSIFSETDKQMDHRVPS